MIIEKVINNNVITAVDDSGQELVLMGKGIGFQTKAGRSITEDRIEKKFVMDTQVDIGKFGELLKSIPLEHLNVCMEIIEYASQVLNKRLSGSIYISLTDHINFALERYRTGLMFENPLLNEIRSFYPSEYLIGEYAVALLEDRMKVKLPVDEAGSIAMHFINAEYNASMSDTMHVTTLIREILRIVESETGIFLDDMEINHAEFVTHLKYLAHRIFKRATVGEPAEQLVKAVECLYERECAIGKQIASFIKREYDHDISDDELVNLTIYIRRVCSGTEKEIRDV